VQDIASDHGAGRLVETLWQMFSALGLAAVAEGVEDADQARLLQKMGCPMAQGYLFGRPARLPRSGADVQDQFADGAALQQVTVGVTGSL
jgi:EAL domain-containing protein (putative c-di-GMP-specific phosphodiesterase class I)